MADYPSPKLISSTFHFQLKQSEHWYAHWLPYLNEDLEPSWHVKITCTVLDHPIYAIERRYHNEDFFPSQTSSMLLIKDARDQKTFRKALNPAAKR